MTRHHGSSIKYDERYENLCAQGYREGKSARIANPSRPVASNHGGEVDAHGQQTFAQLYERASQVGIPRRSRTSNP